MKTYKKLWAEVIDLSEGTDEALAMKSLAGSGSVQAAAITPVGSHIALGVIGGLNKSRFTKVKFS